MTLKDHYNSLPDARKDLVADLADKTCSSISSVYRWMSGEVEPPMLKKKIISEVIGKPIEELFPEKAEAV